MEKYLDRHAAGRLLADQLQAYANHKNVIVLALPRGGVPVAYEIAQKLAVPLDVFIVRKLGVPGHEELAMGAIATGGTVVFNDEIITQLHIEKSQIEHIIQLEERELQRRNENYRDTKPFPDVANQTVILVDDGIATGATMRAAIKALYQLKPAKIIVAVPVAAFSTCAELTELVDQMVCPLKPYDLYAVGAWYEHFSQTSDEEVIALLQNQSV